MESGRQHGANRPASSAHAGRLEVSRIIGSPRIPCAAAAGRSTEYPGMQRDVCSFLQMGTSMDHADEAMYEAKLAPCRAHGNQGMKMGWGLIATMVPLL
jgi:hypothetical protein